MHGDSQVCGNIQTFLWPLAQLHIGAKSREFRADRGDWHACMSAPTNNLKTYTYGETCLYKRMHELGLVSVLIYIYIYIANTYIYIYIYVYVHVYIYVYVYMVKYIYAYKRTHDA
jgi:hypothetical protein